MIARGALLALFLIGAAGIAGAQVPSLTIEDRDGKKTLSLQELLQRNPREITVADAIYGKSMTYRAVPMAEVLKDAKMAVDDYVTARATDGFEVAIPGRLLKSANTQQVEAFLAIQDPASPWPVMPDSLDKSTAGPLYIVWRVNAPGYVSRDYWSAQLAGLKVIDSPLKKWPGLDVAASVPPADRIRTGLDRYVALCLTCHKINGVGGSGAAAGTDLASPKNVTELMDVATIKKFIRNPKGVRPDSKMPKFDDTALSDDDMDALIAYLAHLKR
ncbi:MAG TPA: cytochrome c [Reyranellaceae bacterium]|nr:cytochrome c [Reyranellaceae bacterium]